MHQTQPRASAIWLRDVLPHARMLAGNDIQATSCSADWRICQPGDVFFAVTTADDDGHEHVSQAISRGASAIVTERLVPAEVPQALVRDSRAAFARTCQALAGNPSRQLKTIGIAGTAGKTVTSMLMASVLEADGQDAGVMSSIGHSDSIVQRPAENETPTTAEFAAWLQRMSVANCDAAVLELSSEALAERRASGIELDAAVLTNIKSCDWRQHNSADAYQKILRRVLRQRKQGGVAVVNADDHRCRSLLAHVNGPCLTYALHAEADVTANVLERSPSEQLFLLSAGDDTFPVRTRMIGDHHVSNCLAAAAVGLSLGIELEPIVRGLEAVDRVPNRLERLECGQPFSVFVDAARSRETLSLAIKTVRQVTRGRVFVVFGPSESTPNDCRALLGRVLERGAHVPIITSDDSRRSAPLTTAHDVLDGFERPHKARVVPSRSAAIRVALSSAQPGDSVLIAGGSDGSGESSHDDRELACQWLYAQAEEQPSPRRFRIVG